jgi:hypothetical protein
LSSVTRWFKYDRDKLWLVYTQIVPVIFEPPCIKEAKRLTYNNKIINSSNKMKTTWNITKSETGRLKWTYN